jgi:hypothetical protein
VGIQAKRNETKIGRNEIKAGRNKNKIQRNHIKIHSHYVNFDFSMGYPCLQGPAPHVRRCVSPVPLGGF